MSENKESEGKKAVGHSNIVAPIQQPAPTKGWVQFEEEAVENKDSPAVITTESVQVNLDRSYSKPPESNNVAVLDPKPLRNIELPIAAVEPIRQGFCKWIDFRAPTCLLNSKIRSLNVSITI